MVALHSTTTTKTTLVNMAALLLLFTCIPSTTVVVGANNVIKGYHKEQQQQSTIPEKEDEGGDGRQNQNQRKLAKNKAKVAHVDNGSIQIRGGHAALHYMNGGGRKSKCKKTTTSSKSKGKGKGKSSSQEDECPEGCCGLTDSVTTPNIKHNQDITAIFGSGNPDNGWSLDDRNGVVLALRAKIRGTGAPCSDGVVGTNGINTDGNGIFYMPAGSIGPCATADIANWNIELSVDVDVDSGGTFPDDPNFLNCLQYEFGFDADPSTGTDFAVVPVNFNPFCPPEEGDILTTVAYSASFFGDSNTANGAGQVPANLAQAAQFLNTFPIAQGSQNPTFEFWSSLDPNPRVDPDIEGFYDFFLAAKCGDKTLARIDITVVTIDLSNFDQCTTR